ncbi:MAG: hypothetical protein II433_09055 [Acidaminococcaceae bacterium]|nr:hypothetical protein [Acidaminococcaceae bacterium]
MRPNTVEAGNLGDRGGRCECRTHSVSYQLSHATIYVIRFLGLTVRATSTGTHRIG